MTVLDWSLVAVLFICLCIHFQPGMPVYLIWAYHSSSDTIQNHGNQNRGFPQVTLIPAINPTTSSSPPMTMTAMNTPVPTGEIL